MTLPVQADPGLVIEDGTVPVVRQRVAAYAVVRSSRGLLATEFSARTAVEGLWGMPGGGLDDHEEPAACVLREVAEETSQLVELGPLTAVQTSHWIGRNPHGMIEDFQAVRLIYVGSCPDPTDPVVRDRDGTTNDARWVELDEWRACPGPSAGGDPDRLLVRARGSTLLNPAGSMDVAEQILPGEHADGLAVVEHQQGVAVDQHRDRLGHRLGRADHGQHALHRHADPVGRPGLRVNSAPSRPRSLTEPTTSAAITGGSARTTGIWLTPYSRRIEIASAIVSLGWVWTSDGSSAGLLPQHVADHPLDPAGGARTRSGRARCR